MHKINTPDRKHILFLMSYVNFFILLCSEVYGPTERNSIVNTLSTAMTFLIAHLGATPPICVDVSHTGAFCVSASHQPDLEQRQHSAWYRIGRRQPNPDSAVAFVEGPCVWIG